jgi:peroxiredoxin Q/BCP
MPEIVAHAEPLGVRPMCDGAIAGGGVLLCSPAMRALYAIVFALALGCSGPVKRPDGGVGLLPIGSRAPDIEGRDAGGHDVKLSDVRGKLAVVYFYPSDGSPGCTAEACGFRDAWKRFDDANVVIFGVSADSAESHRTFEHDQQLQFPLVADTSGAAAAAYGVSKTVVGYNRVSFLVDREGRIARIWSEVDPSVHAETVLAEAKRLR